MSHINVGIEKSKGKGQRIKEQGSRIKDINTIFNFEFLIMTMIIKGTGK